MQSSASPVQAGDRNRQISMTEKCVMFRWKLSVFKLNIQGARELRANYFIDIFEILLIKCRLFQFLISGMLMESTIQIGVKTDENQ